MSDLYLRLKNYSLTTAEILYHFPDHPALLQSYIWQELDIAPRFPVLGKFLNFWETSLEGKLHSVKIANTSLITPSTFTFCKGELAIH